MSLSSCLRMDSENAATFLGPRHARCLVVLVCLGGIFAGCVKRNYELESRLYESSEAKMDCPWCTKTNVHTGVYIGGVFFDNDKRSTTNIVQLSHKIERVTSRRTKYKDVWIVTGTAICPNNNKAYSRTSEWSFRSGEVRLIRRLSVNYGDVRKSMTSDRE